MNILMLTNTYLPHVGGVARSVASFAEALRQRDHRVLVVAPTYADAEPGERDGVFRLPAIQHFNASDFSVRIPVPGVLSWKLDRFKPELVHSHHPFLLGDTALRVAASRNLPIVFTHHTMYEWYTHYVPGGSTGMARFARRLATEYANLCDQVIAPSESVAHLLKERGVETPITAIPTGIYPHQFAEGDGDAARAHHGIPREALLVGHVGRLAPEKNVTLLAKALAAFLNKRPGAHALVVGEGPSSEEMRGCFAGAGVSDRLHMPGTLQGQALTDVYHAMDVFAFASQTETQGMVLAEAMTAGVPVVAVDAPGAREVVEDGRNGSLLTRCDPDAITDSLEAFASLSDAQRAARSQAAKRTAERFSMDRCTDRLIELYEHMRQLEPKTAGAQDNAWAQTLRLLELEWHLWSSRTEAAVASLREQFRHGH